MGGALFDRWGYRAPFIFTILFTIFDLTARVLVYEQPHALDKATTNISEKQPLDNGMASSISLTSGVSSYAQQESSKKIGDEEAPAPAAVQISAAEMSAIPREGKKNLTLPQVAVKLLTSTRTLVVLFGIFCAS